MRKNKKRLCTLFLFAIFASTIVFSCGIKHGPGGGIEKRWKPPRPVRIDAKTAKSKYAINISLMAWTSQADQKGSMAVLLRDKDPLFVEFSPSDDALVPYDWNDGTEISHKSDGCGSFLNGKRVVLSLLPGSEGLKWVGKADPKTISGLRMCVLEGPLEGDISLLNKALRKISGIRPDMGWMVQGNDALRRVLDLFNPGWLLVAGNTPLGVDETGLISSEPNLEFLWFSTENLKHKMSLSIPKRLQTLVISDWDTERTGPLPDDLKFLRSLTVVDSPMKDLSGFASIKKLYELHLVSCPNLTDISSLKSFSTLRALTLTDCKKVSDLSAVKKLKKLRWLGLPPGTSQEQFDEIIRTHSDLQVLEMIGCKNITDLAPIRSLHSLESLILLGENKNYTPLHDLKRMYFCALPKTAFEETAHMAALQEAKPDCIIVQAEPFCLGSGWILILWPGLLLGWLLSRRYAGKSLG